MSVDFGRTIVRSSSADTFLEQANANLRLLLGEFDEVDREIIKGNSDDKDPVLAARRLRGRAAAAKQTDRIMSRTRKQSSKMNSRSWSRRSSKGADGQRRHSEGSIVGHVDSANSNTLTMAARGSSPFRTSRAQLHVYNSFERGIAKNSLIDRFGDRPPPPPPIPNGVASRFVSGHAQGFPEAPRPPPLVEDDVVDETFAAGAFQNNAARLGIVDESFVAGAYLNNAGRLGSDA